jgi:hypothetical protein
MMGRQRTQEQLFYQFRLDDYDPFKSSLPAITIVARLNQQRALLGSQACDPTVHAGDGQHEHDCAEDFGAVCGEAVADQRERIVLA